MARFPPFSWLNHISEFVYITSSLAFTHWWVFSLIAQLVKNPPATQESLVQFPVREDPLEKG